MTREETITNLNMISVAFVEPVTKEQRKLIDDTFEMAIQALSQEPKVLNTIDFAIDASNGDTNYFVGFRNGLRYAKSLIDGEEPQFESCAEQEPCDDAVSREELLKAIDTWDKFGVDDTNSLFRLDNLSLPHYVPYIHYDDVIKCIKGMPPVTQKSKTGHWIDYCYQNYRCSECDYIIADSDVDEYKYCPNCGAKMESEDKE